MSAVAKYYMCTSTNTFRTSGSTTEGAAGSVVILSKTFPDQMKQEADTHQESSLGTTKLVMS